MWNLNAHFRHVKAMLIQANTITDASGRHCVPVIFLKICEPEVLTFQYCWRVSIVVLAFQSVGVMTMAKVYQPCSVFSAVIKTF